MNEQIEITCPYCGEINFIEIDITEGNLQNFLQDCEVCCRPIDINVSIGEDGNINPTIKNEEGF